MSANQSSFSSVQKKIEAQLRLLETNLKKKGWLPRSTKLSFSQLAISSAAFLLLVVGLVSATALVKIEQDVRQQAQVDIYRNATCTSSQQDETYCSDGEVLRCANGRWRGTGRNCNEAGPTAVPTNEPTNNSEEFAASGDICTTTHPFYRPERGACFVAY